MCFHYAMISHTVKTSLLWQYWFPDVGKHATLDTWKCIAEINILMDISRVLFRARCLKMEKHITVNFLQVIHRSVWKRYHSKFSRIFTASKYHKERKNKWDPYSYPFYRIYHCPIYWGMLTGNFLWGKLLELGLSLMRKLKFPSELPSRIAVLLAIGTACTT